MVVSGGGSEKNWEKAKCYQTTLYDFFFHLKKKHFLGHLETPLESSLLPTLKWLP